MKACGHDALLHGMSYQMNTEKCVFGGKFVAIKRIHLTKLSNVRQLWWNNVFRTRFFKREKILINATVPSFRRFHSLSYRKPCFCEASIVNAIFVFLSVGLFSKHVHGKRKQNPQDFVVCPEKKSEGFSECSHER